MNFKQRLQAARTHLTGSDIEWAYENNRGEIRGGEIPRWVLYLVVAFVAALALSALVN